MEENSARLNQAKRGSDEIRRDEATLEEKRQKVDLSLHPESSVENGTKEHQQSIWRSRCVHEEEGCKGSGRGLLSLRGVGWKHQTRGAGSSVPFPLQERGYSLSGEVALSLRQEEHLAS